MTTDPIAALVADSRNWPEDSAHENGNYQNRCMTCANTFIGHKRRSNCKSCSISFDLCMALPTLRDMLRDKRWSDLSNKLLEHAPALIALIEQREANEKIIKILRDDVERLAAACVVALDRHNAAMKQAVDEDVSAHTIALIDREATQLRYALNEHHTSTASGRGRRGT